MKEKRTRIGLFAIVGAIWAAVIWRAFFWNGSGHATPTMGDPLAIPEITTDLVRDSFALSLDYRDPFLNGTSEVPHTLAHLALEPRRPEGQLASTLSKPKVSASPETHFRYHGEVRESISGRRTGLLTADGKMLYVDEGNSYTGFEVLHIWQDSIQLRKDEQTFTLRM